MGDPTKPSIPENTVVIPPEVSMVEFITEEVQTSGITLNISNMDTKFNKGEWVTNSGV